MNKQQKERDIGGYHSGKYWSGRSDLIYYKYFEMLVRCLAPQAESIIDVGSGNSPYLEWFDWIPRKVSVDIRAPYSSENVEAVMGNILDIDFNEKFSLCTCMQVLEHIDDPAPFARKLLELSDTVLISVPYKWPRTGKSAKFHPQDPVDLKKVEKWFGRPANYYIMAQEPFIEKKGRRLFAVFNADKSRVYDSADFKNRRKLV